DTIVCPPPGVGGAYGRSRSLSCSSSGRMAISRLRCRRVGPHRVGYVDTVLLAGHELDRGRVRDPAHATEPGTLAAMGADRGLVCFLCGSGRELRFDEAALRFFVPLLELAHRLASLEVRRKKVLIDLDPVLLVLAHKPESRRESRRPA